MVSEKARAYQRGYAAGRKKGQQLVLPPEQDNAGRVWECKECSLKGEHLPCVLDTNNPLQYKPPKCPYGFVKHVWYLKSRV